MNIKIRRILEQDMESVILLLKNNISSFSPPKEEYPHIWENFSKQQNVISVVALLPTDIVIGYGSLMIETKIRGGRVAHIEDIVSDPKHQRLGVGSAILDALKKIALEFGCYRANLSCNDGNISFYKKNGYSLHEHAMVMQLIQD